MLPNCLLAVENEPITSPGIPLLPADTPIMLDSTMLPLPTSIMAPVSISVIGWPSAPYLSDDILQKDSVPMPDVLSLTHIPARYVSFSGSLTGVSATVSCCPSRRIVTISSPPLEQSSLRCSESRTVSPLTAVMTSPALMPADAAGHICAVSDMLPRPTTSAPSVYMDTPMGIPPGITVMSCRSPYSMVFIGIVPKRRMLALPLFPESVSERFSETYASLSPILRLSGPLRLRHIFSS